MVRGFGSQIGRNIANDAYYSSGSIRLHSKSTVFVGTLLVWCLSLIPGAIIAAIIIVSTTSNKVINNNEKQLMGIIAFIISLLGAWLMYRYYQKQNQQYNDNIQSRREYIATLKNKRQEIEQSYINNEITKREYEVLISKINKIEKSL
jgi:ABC-type nickel/cobalt efflux system permease component RcnA